MYKKDVKKMWDAGKKNKGGPRQRPRERSKRGEANGGGITYFFAVAGTRIFFTSFLYFLHKYTKFLYNY